MIYRLAFIICKVTAVVVLLSLAVRGYIRKEKRCSALQVILVCYIFMVSLICIETNSTLYLAYWTPHNGHDKKVHSGLLCPDPYGKLLQLCRLFLHLADTPLRAGSQTAQAHKSILHCHALPVPRCSDYGLHT